MSLVSCGAARHERCVARRGTLQDARLAERGLVLHEAAQVVGCAAASAPGGAKLARGARTAAGDDAVHGAQQLLLLVNRLTEGGAQRQVRRGWRPQAARRTSCS